ncbi:MAG: nucleotidyltransferase domain-containing protein [Candidatus Aminicenantia bacterium]
MLELFQETILWKVLVYFLSHPSTSIYVKELSRKLKISPSGTNRALKLLAKAEVLFKEEKGKAHYYILNNELPFVKFLKIAYFLAMIEKWKIVEKFKNQDENLVSLVIYGSYVTGEFNEKSDIDLLLITSKPKEHFLHLIEALEKYMNKEVNLEVSNLSKWQRIKKENKIFYQEIVNNYILLTGSRLP